ncbi:hypothetical protein IWQ61_010576 [Dispira simplex]|nr:hypothetical protein IWQ61_010576 [Dispira simplex]
MGMGSGQSMRGALGVQTSDIGTDETTAEGANVDLTQDTRLFMNETAEYAPLVIPNQVEDVKVEVKSEVKQEETKVAIKKEVIEEDESGDIKEEAAVTMESVDIKQEYTANLDVDDNVAGVFYRPETDIEDDERLLFFQFPTAFSEFATSGSVDSPTTSSKPPVSLITDDSVPIKEESDTAAPMDTDSPIIIKSEPGQAEEDPEVVPGVSAPDTGTCTPDSAEDLRREGHIGKLLVYKSGKVSLRLNNGVIYDVHTGSHSTFMQQLMAVDTEHKQAFALGNISERLVCTPDLTSIFANISLNEQGQKHSSKPE